MSHLRLMAVLLAVAALLVALPLSGCAAENAAETEDETSKETTAASVAGGEGMATIYLAGGCFWGVEKYMSSVNGVLEAESGYANGNTESPGYDDVVTGRTGYTETVRVVYDPEVAPLPFLLDLFYKSIDPTTVDRQGNDVGNQYRSGIYYVDEADAPVIERSLAQLQEEYDEPIAIEAEELTAFTLAEDYHQDYLEKNPNGYCHIDWELFEAAAAAEPDASHFEDVD